VRRLALLAALSAALVLPATPAAALTCGGLQFEHIELGVPIPQPIDVAVSADEAYMVWVGARGDIHLRNAPGGLDLSPAPRFGSTDWFDGLRPDLVTTTDADPSDDAEAIRRSNETIVGMSMTPTSAGLWMFSSYGRVFPFGDATWLGDLEQLSVEPALPVTGGAATTAGDGYWMFGDDGGLFAFGGAAFHGSVPGALGGAPLAAPIVGMAPSASDGGYMMVAADGGTFAFGDVVYRGSLPGLDVVPTEPIVGTIATSGGYFQLGADGGTFLFGSAGFVGSIPFAASCGRLSYWPGIGDASLSGRDFVSAHVLATGDGYVLTDDLGWTYTFGRATTIAAAS